MSGVRMVPLGWRNSSPQAALAFLPPEPVHPADTAGLRPVVPGVAPGYDLGRRLFVLRAAFNVRIRLVLNNGTPAGFRQVPGPGAITPQAFKGLVSPIVPEAQRGGNTPACQISLNMIFISDVPCSIQLMPPMFWPSFRRWPGTIVCGRFPVTNWPRPLNCVLEWEDLDRDWVISCGNPLACVMPLYGDKDVLPDLFEARMTPALRRHLARIDTVSDYGRNIGPMFARAQAVRPAKLLERKVPA